MLGWYDWESGARLPLASAQGGQTGDEFRLGSVTVDMGAGPQPDIACRLLPESCVGLA